MPEEEVLVVRLVIGLPPRNELAKLIEDKRLLFEYEVEYEGTSCLGVQSLEELDEYLERKEDHPLIKNAKEGWFTIDLERKGMTLADFGLGDPYKHMMKCLGDKYAEDKISASYANATLDHLKTIGEMADYLRRLRDGETPNRVEIQAILDKAGMYPASEERNG